MAYHIIDDINKRDIRFLPEKNLGIVGVSISFCVRSAPLHFAIFISSPPLPPPQYSYEHGSGRFTALLPATDGFGIELRYRVPGRFFGRIRSVVRRSSRSTPAHRSTVNIDPDYASTPTSTDAESQSSRSTAHLRPTIESHATAIFGMLHI